MCGPRELIELAHKLMSNPLRIPGKSLLRSRQVLHTSRRADQRLVERRYAHLLVSSARHLRATTTRAASNAPAAIKRHSLFGGAGLPLPFSAQLTVSV